MNPERVSTRGRPLSYPTEERLRVLNEARDSLSRRYPPHDDRDFIGTAYVAAFTENA